MTNTDRTIEYLRSLAARQRLAQKLDADPTRLSCYYLCPASNIGSVLEHGIMCRATAPAKIDLSSHAVQGRRREALVAIPGQPISRTKRVGIHSTVNFFLNPLNPTFDAFQRNALLLRYGVRNSYPESVLLLELDFERLLKESETYWSFSPGNLASNCGTYYELTSLSSEHIFDWEAIYSCDDREKYPRTRGRAAELIVFIGDEPHSRPVPWSYVQRVIAPAHLTAAHLPSVSRDESHVTLCVQDCFKPARELLKGERWFSYFLRSYGLGVDKEVFDKFVETCLSLLEFENDIGTPGRRPFLYSSPSQRFALHGIGHAVRVMFWSRFLLCYETDVTPDLIRACLLAALIHDLCRWSGGADRAHGSRAVSTFAEHVMKAVGGDGSMLDSVVNAVQMHCAEDDECPEAARDIVWAVLKDADALDRGRFDGPEQARDCQRRYLRSKILKVNDDKGRVPSMAFHLAVMTRNTNWSDTPCADLVMALYVGLKAAYHDGELELTEHYLVDMLLSKLTPIVTAIDKKLCRATC